MRNSTKVLGIALVVALLLGVMALPAVGQASRTRLNWLIADKLTVGSDGMTNAGTMAVTGASTLTGAVTMGNSLTVGTSISVDGSTTLTGDVATMADLSVADKFNVAAQTSITMTQAGTLTPTGSYQPITAGGSISFGDITAGEAGDLLVLINTSSNTITDTGTLKLSGNAALGQYDTITLWSDGTNWIEISETNN